MSISGINAQYEAVEQPSRNFCIFTSVDITDPLDGRKKIVLSNFAAGAIGNLIVIDAETGDGESIMLPGDSGAWALLNLNNEKLLVGTCPDFGYLLCLDLKTRTWAEPLRDPNEQYIWNLALGSDGMVYAGTYPGCVLLRYCPERHVLENMGRVSDNPKNMYSRYLHSGVPGHIIISGGMDCRFLAAWNIENRSVRLFGKQEALVREITEEFICTAHGDTLDFYDPVTFEPISDPTLAEKLSVKELVLESGIRLPVFPFGDDEYVGFRGQDYFICDRNSSVPELRRIPTLAPATTIHTVTVDAKGNIWGCSLLGQTIFCYKPDEGTYWNSSVVCNTGGEVYGMRFVGDQLFMSSYAGGDHIVYDPTKPWDQINNVNPRTLRPVGPDLIRPESKSVIGPDGNIWTGWAANYGIYGGGISRIDVNTDDVSVWHNPVPGQMVAGMDADDRFVYFVTNGGGNGLVYKKDEPCHFIVWTSDGDPIFETEFEPGLEAAVVCATGSIVMVQVGSEVKFFDRDTMAFVQTVGFDQKCTCMIKYSEVAVAAFCGNTLYLIEWNTGRIEEWSSVPAGVKTAAITETGDLYFAKGTTLYRIKKEALHHE